VINPSKMNDMKNQILLYNYWEHFSYAKELALVLPIDHPKRKRLEKSMNELQVLIKKETE